MSLQQTLKALADPTRREILNLLKGGPKSAGELCDRFAISGAAVSRHLAGRRGADLGHASRAGKCVYCGLNASVVEEALLWRTDLKGE